MNKERKRELKKKGKQLVDENSASVRQRLHEENPFHYTDPRWVENYKEVHTKNREFRLNTDHVIAAESLGETARLKILGFKYDRLLVPQKGIYIHCLTCKDLVPTWAEIALHCRCKSVDLDLVNKKAVLPNEAAYEVVKIEALGSIRDKKPWWRFW